MRLAKVLRLFSVLALLALGGCGMPVAVQIVSLLADGVSLLATEKSVSDHGLSALTNQDCAVWRGFKGESICQDYSPAPVIIASQEPANRSESVFEDDFDSEWVDSRSITDPSAMPTKPWTVAVEIGETLEAPAVRRAPQQIASAPQSRPSYAPQNGGYFYVIASYFKPADAERFAGGHPSFTPIVISGTAKGRRVYRVAVGPLIKDKRPTVRAKLKHAGIPDAWGLRLNAPKIITELAAAES